MRKGLRIVLTMNMIGKFSQGSLIPAIGVGACLIGQPVRYNGESKRLNPHIQQLGEAAELRPFCPEMAIGLGVPRRPIRLVGDIGELRLMDSETQTEDFTRPTRAYADWLLKHNRDLSGYILVKGSPSCGYQRVKRYQANGHTAGADATGMFAAELQRLNPLLPVEEDGRLYDPRLRENFVTRVFAYANWLRLQASGLTQHKLSSFWARYKYLVMAHDVPAYQHLGRSLSYARKSDCDAAAAEFISVLMQALRNPASRGGYTNVLHHIRGYLKRELSTAEKHSVDGVIEQYKSDQVPLVVPLTLLKHLFAQYHNAYIDQQVFLFPYPDALGLRNQI